MNIKSIIWCKLCLMPSTRPNLSFNNDEICSQCLNFKKIENINWNSRKSNFEKLVKKIKSKKKLYDCVIPVSGGKDSTWQVIKCLKMGLKPLCVTWKTPFRTKIGETNLQNLINLGVDHIDWTINQSIEKQFVKKTFFLSGSTALPMHYAIFSIPLKVAYKFDIPLVVWGENSAYEYGNDDPNKFIGFNQKWLNKYGVNNNKSISFWKKKISNVDLGSYELPNLKNLSKKTKIIFLGDYFRWDPLVSFEISKKRGFQETSIANVGIYNFADIDDNTINIHHWIKWFKFGFTRDFDNLSIEIRKKRISKEIAIKQIKKTNLNYINKKSVSDFCKYIQINKDKFFKVVEKFRNKNIWHKKRGVWMIKDFIIKDYNWNENK